MAKSTQHVDKLGSFDSFRAPWQTETGEDAEIVPATLARLIYNLKLDKAKALDGAEDAKAALAVAETERDEAETRAADGSGAEAQKKIDKLTKDLEAAEAKVTGYEERDAEAELRKEVLGDFAEKNPKAAKYVTGKTKEDLEKSLEEVKSDWGISDEDEDNDEDEDTDLDKAARISPRGTSLLNPADRSNGKGGEAAIDFDAVAGNILSGGRVFG